MKKILVTTATLSLMLLACGGDISTDINVQGSSPIPRGNVIANVGACGTLPALDNKAYMTNADNGGFQIVVPDINVASEYHNKKLLAERVGDTLHVWEEGNLGSLEWVCYAHHTFDISAEDSDVKYFKFFDHVYEVLPGPAPEKGSEDFIEVAPPDTTVQKSDSASSKTVLANSGPCSLNRTNGGDLAYLTNNEKVGYQIIIPDASAIGYYTDTELKAERIGDTLEVMYPSDTIVKLNWICYVYYTFNIPAEDADVKYLKYISHVYKVVPGPAPEKVPDTSCVRIPPLDKPYEEGVYDTTFCIITTFTPSAEGVYDSTWTVFPYDIYQSSSSTAEATSSSSVINASTHQIITDAQNQCTAQDTTARESYAYRYVSTERTGFTLETLRLTYGIVADTLDVDVSGDTVYVKAVFDFTNAERMYCQSQIHFSVENNPAFSHAKFVAFFDSRDDAEPVILEIYDMDVITVEEATRRHAKDISVECKNDRQTLNRPALQAVTLLPDFDTTSKETFAGRIIGDDGFDKIVINELDVGCSVNNVELVVSASEDTLYVKSSKEMYGTNCICPSRIEFKIPQDFNFSNAYVLVFDHFEPMPLVTGEPINN